MKKIKIMVAIGAIALLSMTTISAAWSNIFTVGVPRWGGWSDPSPQVRKTDTTRHATFYLNTSSYSFKVYGDLIENGSRSTKKYYQLSLRKNTFMDYTDGKGKKDTYQSGRMSTSNYEPDYRYATFKFNP